MHSAHWQATSEFSRGDQMNRLQEVREFELITGSEAYRDRNIPGIRYCEFFYSLKNFVLEYSTRNDDSDILEFMKPGFKRNIGEYFTIRQGKRSVRSFNPGR